MNVNSATDTPAQRPTRRCTRRRATVDYNAFLQLLIAQMKNQDPTNPTDIVAIHEPVRAPVLGRAGDADQHQARHAAVLARALSQADRPDRPHGDLHQLQTVRPSTGKVASVSIIQGGAVATLEDGTKVPLGPGVTIS